jgi:DGQHR domain-containing protein
MVKKENKQNRIIIPCIRFRQNGKEMFTGTIKLSQLVELNTKVDQFMAKDLNTNHLGYQRAPEPRRAKKFGEYISHGATSPTGILLSIRDEDIKLHADIEEYSSERNTAFPIVDTDIVKISIDPDCLVYVVDGQHRLTGIENCDVYGKLADYAIPFTLLWGNDKYQEANQFVIINKTQKIVRTDLAERFVAMESKRRGLANVSNDPNIAIFKNAEWIGAALDILDSLTKKSKIWSNRVKLPNEPKGETTVSQKSFTDSLQIVLTDSLNGKKECDVVDILDAFWDAIKQNCSEPFDTTGQYSAKDYALQQTIGVMAMHRVLNMLYKNLWKVLKPKHFVELLNVDEVANHENWDRTLAITGDPVNKGGKWTLMGTNNKSFRIIEGNIMRGIMKTKIYKQLDKEQRDSN